MKRFGLMRTVAAAVVCAGLSWQGAAAFGQMQSDDSRLHPCNGNGCCRPNIPYAGYYQTTWRHWPGEQDLGETNPRAPVSEILPTPQGYEPLPPTKSQQPQSQKQPSQTQESPSSTIPPLLPGTIQPPGGLLSPHDMPSEPEVKPENKLESPSTGKPETKPEQKPAAKSEPLPAGAGLPASSPTESAPKENKPSTTEPLPMPGSNMEPKDKSSSTGAPRTMQSLLSPEMAAKNSNATNNLGTPSSDYVLANGAAQPPADLSRNAATSTSFNAAAKSDGVVAVASDVEPDRGVPSYNANRADPISATPAPRQKAEVEPTGYAEAAAPAKLMKPEVTPSNFVADQAPAAMPTVALSGYCPIELLTHGRWVQGDLRFSAVYEGRIYRFAGAEQRQTFLAAPTQFSPVNSGNDTVLLVNENRTVAGLPAYCAVYNGRLYMFSSIATQAEFNNNPTRYIPAK